MEPGLQCFRHAGSKTTTANSPTPTPDHSGRTALKVTAWILVLGVYGAGAAVIGFNFTSSPLAGVLMAKHGMISDEDSLSQFVPDDETTIAINEYINGHQLAHKLRSNPQMIESRPHLKIPAVFRRHNLTAGTLLGPGRIVVPPIVWTDGGQSLVSISYLGSDLCGHPGIIHGGVLATMLDEGLARCCWDALPRQTAVTAKLEVNYRKPTRAGSYVVLKARTIKVEGRKAWVEGHVELLSDDDSEPQVLAQASGLFVSPRPSTVSLDIANNLFTDHQWAMLNSIADDRCYQGSPENTLGSVVMFCNHCLQVRWV